MAELTGLEVTDSLATKIRAAFTLLEIAAVYQDKPLQGMEYPCVFFHPLDTENQDEMFSRATQSFLLDIRIHPSPQTTDVQSWAKRLCTKLLEVVRVITVSGQAVKSRNITWSVQEDVLHVIVKYAFRVVFVEEQAIDMETIDITERVN